MSSKGTSRLQPGSSTSVSPDSYHIDHVKLTTPISPGTITTTDIVKEVIIRDRVTQPYVESVIFIADSVGLFHNLNLTDRRLLSSRYEEIQRKDQNRTNKISNWSSRLSKYTVLQEEMSLDRDSIYDVHLNISIQTKRKYFKDHSVIQLESS